MKKNVIHNISLKSNTYNAWKGITLSDSAVKQIKKLINEESNMLGLKVTIKKSGCAGFSYKINKVFDLEKNIIIYERDGAKLFIPKDIMSMIDGTELDYIQDGLNYMFKFNNPKARFSCGCGTSFNI